MPLLLPLLYLLMEASAEKRDDSLYSCYFIQRHYQNGILFAIFTYFSRYSVQYVLSNKTRIKLFTNWVKSELHVVSQSESHSKTTGSVKIISVTKPTD